MPNLLFDLGGVLIDWDPRYLYRKLLPDEAAVERFLDEVCTSAWNLSLDAGRSFDDGVAELVERHPEQADLVRAFRDRWPEMLAGAFDDVVAILAEVRERHPVYALTNWSAETYPVAVERFAFLGWFEGTVVSGEEAVIKPDPAIYRIVLDRYGLDARDTVFIDDKAENVAAAEALGFDGIVFTDAAGLRDALAKRGIV